jgi:hypothetical protein
VTSPIISSAEGSAAFHNSIENTLGYTEMLTVEVSNITPDPETGSLPSNESDSAISVSATSGKGRKRNNSRNWKKPQ